MKALLKAAIYTPLFNVLIFLVWLMPNHSLALAIIGLTLIIRLVFLPSSLKQGVSQEKLRLLQPKIKELQSKHKNDRTAQSKAMMGLYKQAGTSPWGACLPMIVQLIVLILLYRVFQIGLSTARFDLLYSWVPRPDSINTFFFGINLSQPDLWVLPILAGIFQFLQSFLAMPKKDPKQKDDNPMMAATSQMMYFFPIITVFIARKLPAALAIYWITTSLFMVLQQLYINRVLKPRARAHMENINASTSTPSIAVGDNKMIATPDKVENKKSDQVIGAGKGVSVTIRKRGQ